MSKRKEPFFHPVDGRDAREIIRVEKFDKFKRKQNPPKDAWPKQVGDRCKCGCGKKAKRVWFSSECNNWVRTNLYMYCGWNLRHQTERRDKGACAVCDLDTYKLRALIVSSGITPDELKRCFHTEPPTFDHPEKNAVVAFFWAQRNSGWNPKDPFVMYHRGGFEVKSLWDADHIKPVRAGGGALGLSNMRTLCRACHRRKGKDSGEPYEMTFTYPLIGTIRYVHPVY